MNSRTGLSVSLDNRTLQGAKRVKWILRRGHHCIPAPAGPVWGSLFRRPRRSWLEIHLFSSTVSSLPWLPMPLSSKWLCCKQPFSPARFTGHGRAGHTRGATAGRSLNNYNSSEAHATRPGSVGIQNMSWVTSVAMARGGGITSPDGRSPAAILSLPLIWLSFLRFLPPFEHAYALVQGRGAPCLCQG